MILKYIIRLLRLTVSKEGLSLIAICIADAVLTVALVSLGFAREANPLMARCLSHGLITFYSIKLGVSLCAVAAAELYAKLNPVFVRKALQTGTVAYLSLYLGMVLIVNV